MNGHLAQRALSDVLADVQRRQASGVLRIQKDATTRQIFIDVGVMIRFAVSTLIAFVAIGAVVSVVLARQIRHRQEGFAQFHAVFVTNSILRYELTTKDLAGPLAAGSPRYEELAQFVKSRVVQAPVVRVKILSADGTVLFSDEPRLDGRRFAFDGDLEIAFGGGVQAGVSNLTEPENTFERALAPKLFETYVPLRLGFSSSASIRWTRLRPGATRVSGSGSAWSRTSWTCCVDGSR